MKYIESSIYLENLTLGEKL